MTTVLYDTELHWNRTSEKMAEIAHCDDPCPELDVTAPYAAVCNGAKPNCMEWNGTESDDSRGSDQPQKK
ncbi:MAG: hypothetical protein G01um101438_1005 [Parcubacteria group bacterium Gr01-1014_38]|nr:MAG: hypothetical protein G01um101438_1005 [Parcubacteria group bacterium Gr01-1014_38]